MERNYLLVQGGGYFYHIYCFINQTFFLFLAVFLIILLTPSPQWLKNVFLGILFLDVILQAAGDWKYHRKRPEE
ncbi:hypothetical protein [Caproicibacter fermentans]|uniref:Uncharacterized protein n=1 Tax=Caproicibacter fermentans TaxID=2576756 RepID=A0A7G8T6U2_9FIRM|nr:hypothetical protein [Caproicibacter fermentans]QNK39333.1 hypothetical protein HCR03_11245 [Caproicibacter fermentans]